MSKEYVSISTTRETETGNGLRTTNDDGYACIVGGWSYLVVETLPFFRYYVSLTVGRSKSFRHVFPHNSKKHEESSSSSSSSSSPQVTTHEHDLSFRMLSPMISSRKNDGKTSSCRMDNNPSPNFTVQKKKQYSFDTYQDDEDRQETHDSKNEIVPSEFGQMKFLG